MGDAVSRTNVDVFMIRHHGKLEVISLHFNSRGSFYGLSGIFPWKGLTRNGLNMFNPRSIVSVPFIGGRF